MLHMADMHLAWPFAGDGPRAGVRREELKAVFTSMIDLAIEQQVQILLIAGDLFEHAHAGRGLIKFIDDQFRRIAGVHVFISPGNHDPLLPDSYYRSYPWAPNVYIFGPTAERVDLPDMPVSVYGWGFDTWEVRDYRLAGLRVVDPSRVNLVVLHGGDEKYHPFRPADLAAIGADYIALGHIHKEGSFLEQQGRVIARYSGSPEALGFGEPGEHGVYLGSVEKQVNRMAWVPTGRRRYITAEVDVSGAISLEDVAARMTEVAEPAARAQHAYRLTLTGAVDPELLLDLTVLQATLADQFYLLKLADRTSPDYDLAALSRERSARGLFVQRLQTMAAAEPDPAVRRRIERALALGLAAFGGPQAGDSATSLQRGAQDADR